MGLTDRQVRNIMNYKAKGGKFYSKNDLGKLYTISEEELDVILGKIKVAGYDALTDEEKDALFKASRRRTP
jgi:hypothetical protein